MFHVKPQLLLRFTISTETSDALTPEILIAWPMFSGLIFESFSTAHLIVLAAANNLNHWQGYLIASFIDRISVKDLFI